MKWHTFHSYSTVFTNKFTINVKLQLQIYIYCTQQ